MKKQFAAVGAVIMALSLTTCSTPADARIHNNLKTEIMKVSNPKDFLTTLVISSNTAKLHTAIKKLKKYVNKTWYVFSGDTPRGWDCSGLVKWTYDQLGIDLKHSASVQKNSGTIHKTPKLSLIHI